jgi:hypothetical protein
MAVRQPMEQGCRQRRIAEYFCPLSERQVRGHQQRSPFASVGKNLKQQLRALCRK